MPCQYRTLQHDTIARPTEERTLTIQSHPQQAQTHRSRYVDKIPGRGTNHNYEAFNRSMDDVPTC